MLSALHSHWRTETLLYEAKRSARGERWMRRETYEIAPSKAPARKGIPCPMSARKRSPSTSRSNATSLQGEERGQRRTRLRGIDRFGGSSRNQGRLDNQPAVVEETEKMQLTKHTATDIHANPFVTLLRQDLARKTGSSSNIKQVRRPGNILVLVRWWPVLLRGGSACFNSTRARGGGTHRSSSSRQR